MSSSSLQFRSSGGRCRSLNERCFKTPPIIVVPFPAKARVIALPETMANGTMFVRLGHDVTEESSPSGPF